jgi:hypothetical protein
MFTLQLCHLYIISLACHNHGKIVTCLAPWVATHGCAAERRVNYREPQPAPKGKIILPNAVYLFVVAAASLKNIWVACDCLPDVRRISKNINTHMYLYLYCAHPSFSLVFLTTKHDLWSITRWLLLVAILRNQVSVEFVHVYQSYDN